MADLASILVVIPTYNEKDNIVPLIQALCMVQLPLSILVVDGGSPDGTSGLVSELQHQYKNLYLLQQGEKSGLGAAYWAGFSWGLSHRYAYIFSFDGDLSHRPSDLVNLYRAAIAQRADLVIGSRYVVGGGCSGWGWHRLGLSYLANGLARWVTSISIRDLTAGFVCYHRSILEKILPAHHFFSSYTFQVQIKFLACRYGGQCIEVPIAFDPRMHGKSKLSLAVAYKSVVDLFRLIRLK